MKKKVIVVGGGVAGMEAASTLAELGCESVIVEKDTRLGGKVNGWYKLFPSLTPAGEVVGALSGKVERAGVDTLMGSQVVEISPRGVKLADGSAVEGDAVIVATGYDLFDASIKEEYGYGIYANVFTSVDFEHMMAGGRIATADGRTPQRVAFLHCVGSRDEKIGQSHCSRVCCITAVKQAMELREMVPGCEIYNFYMDIRMFGAGYEEMYREAQQRCNVQFVRGRISEASETIDHRIQIKAEDTLVGRPLKTTVDMLVLVVGMTAGESNACFASCPGVERAASGFLAPRDSFTGNVCSDVPGIFYAGAVTAPKNIGESISEGSAAAMRAFEYLNDVKIFR